MPKRKKSHEYCRNRFGIFNKRRRVSTDHRCEECANVRHVRSARPVWPRRQSLDRSETGALCSWASALAHDLSSGGPIRHHNEQLSPESSCAPWWNSGENDSTMSATTEDDFHSAVVPLVVAKSACNCSISPVCDYIATPGVESADTVDRSLKVSSLVALTSSLKLSEDESSSCASGSVMLQKALIDKTLVNHSRWDFDFYLPQPKRPVAPGHLLDFAIVPASSSHSVDMRVSFNESRPLVGSHRPHSRQSRRFPLLMRVNDPIEDCSSDDSDEGFCEPVSNKLHKLPSSLNGMSEPDEGVNVLEEPLPSVIRHRCVEYTNHSLDASLGCTSSLYWQMMSNRYGVPTKIYSMERNSIIRPFEGYTLSVPGVRRKSDCGVSVLGWTQNTVTTTSPAEKDVFDFEDPGVNTASANSGQEEEGGVFAVGKLVQDLTNVQGALGLCLRRAVQCNKSVFVFDCQASHNAAREDGTCKWYRYCRMQSRFVPCRTIPELTQHFAGLGANELTEAGRTAIKAVFQQTFGAP